MSLSPEDPRLIGEIETFLKQVRLTGDSSLTPEPDPGTRLTSRQLYDAVMELWPMAVTASIELLGYNPEYRTVNSIVPYKDQLCRVIYDPNYGVYDLTLVTRGPQGQIQSVVEDARLHTGIDGTEDPEVPLQDISYLGPKLFHRHPNKPEIVYGIHSTDRVFEEMKDFYTRLRVR